MLPHAPRCTLFPYTTLFRSVRLLTSFARATASVTGGEHAGPVQTYARAFAPSAVCTGPACSPPVTDADRKSTRLNSSHVENSYAVFCLKKKISPNTIFVCLP